MVINFVRRETLLVSTVSVVQLVMTSEQLCRLFVFTISDILHTYTAHPLGGSKCVWKVHNAMDAHDHTPLSHMNSVTCIKQFLKFDLVKGKM